MDEFSEHKRKKLTLRLTQIMEFWQLSDQEQIALLGLPKTLKARHLYLYRRGDKAFDFEQNTFERAKMILGIYAALGTTYPTNQEYGSIWLKRSVKKFKHKTPLSLMLSGNTGMRRVWHFLDCTQSWED